MPNTAQRRCHITRQFTPPGHHESRTERGTRHIYNTRHTATTRTYETAYRRTGRRRRRDKQPTRITEPAPEPIHNLWACAVAGVQPAFHAIGDDGVSAVARALRRATARLEASAPGFGTVRMAGCVPRIEYAEMADAEAIAAFAATGTVACMQPMFDAAWGGPDGMYARRLGRERAPPMNALAQFASAGVALALSSDAPVTPASPWLARCRLRCTTGPRVPDCPLVPRSPHTPGEGVGRWSTDPRSRVPLLPDLTPGAPMPSTLATIVGGRVAHDVGLLGGVVDAVAVSELT